MTRSKVMSYAELSCQYAYIKSLMVNKFISTHVFLTSDVGFSVNNLSVTNDPIFIPTYTATGQLCAGEKWSPGVNFLFPAPLLPP